MIAGLTGIERRVLAYLDQRGPSHRSNIAADLTREDSRTARFQNGSNGAVPLIVGRWCKRLIAWGYVRDVRDCEGFYQQHQITAQGKEAVRALSHQHGAGNGEKHGE